MSGKSFWPVLAMLPFLAAPWISPHDPDTQYRESANLKPGCGHPCFLMGSDAFGRDVFSRTLHGGRTSLLAGAGATLLALLYGALLGAAAGLAPGIWDEMLSRPVDIVLSMPWFYLLLIVRAALPLSAAPGEVLAITMAAIGIAGAGAPFRVTRQKVRQCLESEPVRAAWGLGAGRWHVLRDHLLPAAMAPLQSMALTLFPQFVLAEVALSYLGLGPGEAIVSWGSVLAPLREYAVLTTQWWMFAPVLTLALVVFSLSRYAKGNEA